jgi:hypothetical protein
MRRLLSVVAARMATLAVAESARCLKLRDRRGGAPAHLGRGAVIGIEVKPAETVRADDFRGLRHLARRLGDRFRAGIAIGG